MAGSGRHAEERQRVGDRWCRSFNGFGDLRNHAPPPARMSGSSVWIQRALDRGGAILALIAGSPPPSKFLLPWGGVTRF
jgi:hypothetical protein